ncbi:MAG: glutamine-synthetase adenylyltransferase [Boseongicola sp.]|nr:MAG: glutamine-synthetase adenylyltransferase [Boseongicola sp.]
MTFASRLSRCAIPFDADRGAEALAHVGTTGPLADLIKGAGGSSPYLAELMAKEADWISEALKGDPEAARDDIMSAVQTMEDAALAPGLRQSKRRLALLAALADLGGVWSLEDVTGALSDFAAAATHRALKAGIANELRRNKLPGQGDADLETCGGLSVLAMGKMGAGELNYSSDIDLICLYDETRFDPDDYGDARASFVRAVRRMTQLLSERTADGYVFRTDLRLRPDASVTPVAISMEAAERYYEAFGRTWERAAYIKARAAAGDIAAGEKFLKTLTPFVWRRHLDYAAIQDAHDMRLRIRDHKGLHKAPSHLGHDLKLGQGGIREIEFFTQTRQIISGGRDPELRVSGTVEGLEILAAKGWVNVEDAQTLTGDYRALREAEHRVQMVADQQTHKLPTTEDEFTRLANLAGTDPATYKADLLERFDRVHQLTEGFFAPDAVPASPVTDLPGLSPEITDRWMGYPALRTTRAVNMFNRMRPVLMDRLAKAARPEEALVHFDGFLAGLPAGVQLFALFEANPQLLDLVVDIVDSAPALGQHLARNSGVFDAVIGGEFFSEWPGADGLTGKIGRRLNDAPDYEARLNLARTWSREWHFRIGVHHLRGLIDAETAGQQYADLAEAAVAALWPHVVDEFASKHGQPPGQGACVLGMGSLGARRLNAASDLDLIVIYDGAGVDASDGRRPLATRAYYARLTQALVTAISAPTGEGRLYEVDMRLRPSGRQGPVATGLESFRTYQTSEAWTWEHLALTRARAIAGEMELGREIESFRQELLAKPRDRASVLKDVSDMRARLAEAKPATNRLDAKAGAGRLQDIELFGQTGCLLAGASEQTLTAQLDVAYGAFNLPLAQRQAMSDAARLYWRVQSSARLISGTGPGEADVGAGASAFMLRETGSSSLDALLLSVVQAAETVAEIIDNLVDQPTSGDEK